MEENRTLYSYCSIHPLLLSLSWDDGSQNITELWNCILTLSPAFLKSRLLRGYIWSSFLHLLLGGGGVEPTFSALSSRFWVVDGPGRIPARLSAEAAGSPQRGREGVSEPKGRSGHSWSGLQRGWPHPLCTQRTTASRKERLKASLGQLSLRGRG